MEVPGLEGMIALVQSYWPLLRMLEVSCFDGGGDDDTVAIQKSGNWPASKCLKVPDTTDQGLLCPDHADVLYGSSADSFEHVASVQWHHLKTLTASH